MPRLSVILPVKNGEKFLRRAVSSTLRALPRDAELVVLDDGSTDSTPSILAEYGDRIVVHQNHGSRGLAQGLNYLLQVTDSEFVARMDADDVCLPWRFRRQLALTRIADLVFTAIVFVNGHGVPARPDLAGPIGPDAAVLHLVLASCFSHPTMLARRSSLPEEGYRELAAEDYDMWLRVAASGGRIVRDPLPGLLYRRHREQVSGSAAWKMRRSRELADPRAVAAYADVLTTLRLPSDPPSGALHFAMSSRREDADGAEQWIAELHAVIRSRIPSLRKTNRPALDARLRRLHSRLTESISA